MIGAHHSFGPASGGLAACRSCGRSYSVEDVWRADVDPCADGVPTMISEEQAQEKYRRFLSSIGIPFR